MQHQGLCSTNVTLDVGIHTIEFRWYDGGELRCRDQLLFASQYDVGVIKQYVSPPPAGVCASSPSQEVFRFIPSDCGVAIQ